MSGQGGQAARRLVRGRHLVALACAALVAILVLRQCPGADLRVRVGFVGMLYALALGVALVPRPGAAVIGLFAATGGLLDAATAQLALLVGPGPRLFGVPVVLAVSAAVGAVAYALVLRATWFGYLGARATACLALACAVVVTLVGRSTPPLGDGLWLLSVAWWLMFSSILCHLDARAHRAR